MNGKPYAKLFSLLNTDSIGLKRIVLISIALAISEVFLLLTIYPIFEYISGAKNELSNTNRVIILIQNILGGILEPDEIDITIISIVSAGAVTVALMLKLMSVKYSSVYTQQLKYRLTTLTYGVYNSKTYEELSKKHSSSIEKQIIFEVDQIYSNLIAPLVPAIVQSFSTVIILSGMFYIYTIKSLFLIGGIILVYVLVALNVKSKVSRFGKQIYNLNKDRHELVAENFRNLRFNFISGRYRDNYQSYDENSEKIKDYSARLHYISTKPKIFIENGILYILLSLILFQESFSGIQSSFFAEVSIILLASMRVLPGVQSIYAMYMALNQSKVSIEEYSEILGEIIAGTKRSERKVNNTNQHPNGELKIIAKGVRIVFADDREIFLKNKTIDENTCLLIEGPSGSGKSTILDNLLGLRMPDAGSITYMIGETELPTANDIWPFVAYVPQEIKLPYGTIREYFNVTEGNVDFLRSCAEITGVSDLIFKAGSFTDFNIMESGSNFSGGQRQRIALCAALMTKPKLLILDEATSGLPEDLAEKLIENVKSQVKCGLIVVTHQRNIKHLFTDRLELSE